MISEKRLKQLKRKYANLMVVSGLNAVKDKYVTVDADLDDPELVEMIVDELYNRGAKRVIVKWFYRPVMKTIYQRTSLEELIKITPIEIAELKFDADNYNPSIVLESWDPMWAEGIDTNKLAKYKEVHSKIARPYNEKMDAIETPWLLAAVPSVAWAKRIFPKLSDKEALYKMWELTFDCVRVSKGDPNKNWEKFNKEIKARAKWLDSLHIKSLHYTSKNGTDLIVGINPLARFCGGCHDSIPGIPTYNPNMPAVECFTTPVKNMTEGIAVASKPLCKGGQLIKDFSIRFHNGRIVEVHAKTGEKALKELIESEEGTHYIGEAALVPYDSPVSNTKTIYYQTLFDENAACHLAIGYSLCTTYLPKAKKMNDKELIKNGFNRGSQHVDFMIGTSDLNIVATTFDDKKVDIFKNGNWANKL